MLHERDGVGLSVDGARVVDPVRAFSPAIAVLVAVAVEHVPFAFGFIRTFHPHGFSDADGGGAFFGVAEGDGFFCGQLDREVDGARGGGDGVQPEGLFGNEVNFPVLLGDPVLGGVDGAGILASFGLEDSGVLDFRVTFEALDKALCFTAFGPEVEAVDIAVGEPEGAVVRMVVIFALALFHGVGAGEGFSAWADDGVVKHVRCGAEMVGSEQVAIDGHDDSIAFGFDLHIGAGGEGEAGGGEDRASDPAREGGDERTHGARSCTECAIGTVPSGHGPMRLIDR